MQVPVELIPTLEKLVEVDFVIRVIVLDSVMINFELIQCRCQCICNDVDLVGSVFAVDSLA